MQLVSSAPVYAMQHNIIVKYGKGIQSHYVAIDFDTAN